MSAETILVFNNLFAILTLVALAGAIGLLVYRVVKGPEAAAFSATMRSGWLLPSPWSPPWAR